MKYIYFLLIVICFTPVLFSNKDEVKTSREELKKLFEEIISKNQAINNHYTTEVSGAPIVISGNDSESLKQYLDAQHSWKRTFQQGVAGAIAQGGGQIIADTAHVSVSSLKRLIIGKSKLEQIEEFHQESVMISQQLNNFLVMYNNLSYEEQEQLATLKEQCIKLIQQRAKELEELLK